MRIAFVSGLSDRKLAQKLAPLQALTAVERIDLFRRQRFTGEKVRWIPARFQNPVLGDLYRLGLLLRCCDRYDLIVGCHQKYHGIYAALAARVGGSPIVQMVITDPDRVSKMWLGSWALSHADAIAVRGPGSGEKIRRDYPFHPHPFILHNVWCPPRDFAPVAKTHDLLFVGGFVRSKNLRLWLRTAAEVKQRRGSLRAALVGDRPRGWMLDLARRLNILEDLEFPGWTEGEDLDRYYRGARVFLLTSRYEGLPMVVAEALANGVPVVSSDAGDVRTWIEHGDNGWLVPNHDPRAAADAIVRLLDSDDLHRRCSMRAVTSSSRFADVGSIGSVSREWSAILKRLGLAADRIDED